MSELHYLSLVEVAEKVQAREISAVEVVEHQLDRIGRLDPALSSFTLVTGDLALKQARAADAEIAAGRVRGPLHGAPVAVKDVFWTRDSVTAAGTRVFADFVADEDATVIRRLRDAGAILLGKLTTTEATYSVYHPDVRPAVNPWRAELWAGASSSGSGVATAAGLCFGSLGTDTSGSIRVPAAVNGIVGLKPTWGRISRHGLFAAAPSLDHIGPMTRTVADASVMLAALAGHDENDPSASDVAVGSYPLRPVEDLRSIRLGFDPAHLEAVDEATRVVVRNALEVFLNLGADVRETRLPSLDGIGQSLLALAGPEVSAVHQPTFSTRRADYGASFAGFLDAAASLDESAKQSAIRYRHALTAQMTSVFSSVDAIILPVMSLARIENGRMDRIGDDMALLDALVRFTCPFNLCGFPALVLPGGANADGSPISFQLAGPAFGEASLLNLGLSFEAATDWGRRRPPVG